MAKLIAFFAVENKEKVWINPDHVVAAMPTGEDQTTILTANAQGRHKYTVGGVSDEVAAKLNAQLSS